MMGKRRVKNERDVSYSWDGWFHEGNEFGGRKKLITGMYTMKTAQKCSLRKHHSWTYRRKRPTSINISIEWALHALFSAIFI